MSQNTLYIASPPGITLNLHLQDIPEYGPFTWIIFQVSNKRFLNILFA